MDELFASPKGALKDSPLADHMRPQVLDDIVGQDHIVGEGRLLRRAIQADRLSSVIFYGPPGTGKTSLARVIANTTRSVFESLNAVLTGIKDIREVIDRSDERRRLYSRRTILFVDEVHRWNKAQQDALLPWVENGTVILIGATTENPFFEVNRALVSRSRIFQLKSLDSDALLKTALKCLSDTERGYGKWKVSFEEGALEHLVEVANGDARSLLNALELAVETSPSGFANGQPAKHKLKETFEESFLWPPPEGTEIYVSMEAAEESIQRRALLYDKDGDYHYDTISAFIKSVRGSDPDASLYWLAKMVRAGEDPAFIFRRMIILAMEDVGLADPTVISTVISCAEAFDRIGFPEGNFALSEACLCLATAPKSNTTLAYFDALKEVEREDAEVPNHLRDGSRDKEGFGHGEGYIYPHAFREHWAAQQYLPSPLKGRVFYKPSSSGKEALIQEEILKKREIQAAVIFGSEGDSKNEILTWSSSSKGREQWFKRLESGRAKLLLSDRDRIFRQCNIERHHRILIPRANDGLLLWESLRRCPEGLTAALVDTNTIKETLLGFFSNSFSGDECDAPIIQLCNSDASLLPDKEEAKEAFNCTEFDHIILREAFRRQNTGKKNIAEIFSDFAAKAKKLLAKDGDISLLQSPPKMGERISRILKDECKIESSIYEKLNDAENSFFNRANDDTLNINWDASLLGDSFSKAGYIVNMEEINQEEERLISLKDLSIWFDGEKSLWGAFILDALGKEDFNNIKSSLEERTKEGPLLWKYKSILLYAKVKS